jgi:hypothetical protein
VPGRVLLVAHHLVVDGVSWRIIGADLATADAATLRGESPALDSGTSYLRWARMLTARANEVLREAELPSWLSLLAGPAVPLARRALDPARWTLSRAASTGPSWPCPDR